MKVLIVLTIVKFRNETEISMRKKPKKLSGLLFTLLQQKKAPIGTFCVTLSGFKPETF
jgi:hypothetical protein